MDSVTVRYQYGNLLRFSVLWCSRNKVTLGQMLTDWVGEQGTLKKLSCSHRAMRHPCSPIICKGKVTKNYIEDGRGYIECEIWAENKEGQKSTPGTALLCLPFRA